MASWELSEYNQWIEKGCPVDLTVKELLLSNNNLPEISKHVWKLRNLVFIDISNNSIQSIPSVFGTLHNLRSLDISFNPIKSLSQEVRKLPKLRTIKIDVYNILLVRSIEYSDKINLLELEMIEPMPQFEHRTLKVMDVIDTLKNFKILICYIPLFVISAVAGFKIGTTLTDYFMD
jgi:Leucine-rich repeat (LRR) protein